MVNVTQLQAVFRGGSEPEANVMVYEVDVPQKHRYEGASVSPEN